MRFLFCSDPYFLYTAGAAVSKMNLKKWAEPFASMSYQFLYSPYTRDKVGVLQTFFNVYKKNFQVKL